MKIKKNGVSINLTESDLKRIVKEQSSMGKSFDYKSKIKTAGFTTEQEDVINDIYDKMTMILNKQTLNSNIIYLMKKINIIKQGLEKMS